jgi:hypothetical protein
LLEKNISLYEIINLKNVLNFWGMKYREKRFTRFYGLEKKLVPNELHVVLWFR